jgi:ketosteroid isomerase-like protein
VTDEMLDLCERFFDAVTRRDLDAVREIYAPDAVIWNNFTNRQQTVEENLRTLAWATSSIDGFRYEDVRRYATETGFVEQHVLRGAAPAGTDLDVPACIVCTVRDGRITRLDEYVDSAHIAPLFAERRARERDRPRDRPWLIAVRARGARRAL